MKTTIPAIALISLAAGAVLAQQPDRTSRSFPVRGFDRIDMSGCDMATVTLGPAFGVTAQGHADNIDHLRIDTRGTTLRIRRTDNSCNGRDRRVAIAITLPVLKAAHTSGAVALTLPVLDTPRFEAEASGASVLRVAGLRALSARFDLSGATEATLRNIRVDRVELDLSGAGVVRADGEAGHVALDSSGTGQIDARGLSAAEATISASGMARVRAAATQAAKVDASGMANVAVETPVRCTIAKSGMARVTCGR